MENAIPRGDWYEADEFRELVQQLATLDLGGWSLEEFEHATAALDWELQEPDDIAGQVWRRFAPRKGPWGGYATLVADAADPDRMRRLNVRLVDLPAEDVSVIAGHVRAAWWVMEEELGPSTMWGGDADPWMLWVRPGTSFIVRSHDGGEMSFELLNTATDADAAGRGDSRGAWRAADPADLPSAASTGPATDWAEVQKRLYTALHSLNYDAPFFPGMFTLHLASAHDPKRFVQCWSHGLSLVVEATGYMHHPDLADPDRLTQNGWKPSHSLWQRRFPNAMDDREHARTAARMIVDELRHLGIDLADLVYSGTMVGRGRHLHLDLPGLGLSRTLP
ncbi:hypothetical protein ACQEU3_45515 [Spirillospora sp. CA-253888]